MDEYDAKAEGEGIGGSLLALEAKGLLTPDEEPSGTTLADAYNGFNELSRLKIICTVNHR